MSDNLEPQQRPWKRRWYTYPFLNPRLQLGLTLVPLIAGAIVAIYFSWLLYLYSLDVFMQLTSWFPEKAPTENVIANFKHLWLKTTIFIVIFELLILPILGLFFSHRLAGPLFVITKRLRELKDGKFPEEIKLRKGSFLQDFTEDFNESVSALKAKDDVLRQCIHDASRHLENGDVEAAKKSLQDANA